jgi:hypothetical protein
MNGYKPQDEFRRITSKAIRTAIANSTISLLPHSGKVENRSVINYNEIYLAAFYF